ncbi:hypothetical protein BHOIPH791_03980 [Bartonella henselae]
MAKKTCLYSFFTSVKINQIKNTAHKLFNKKIVMFASIQNVAIGECRVYLNYSDMIGLMRS